MSTLKQLHIYDTFILNFKKHKSIIVIGKKKLGIFNIFIVNL
jgi:hypothetical protein